MYDVFVKEKPAYEMRISDWSSDVCSSDLKAWRLIDEAGCRGLTKGAAQVSEKHCNFLLNLGGASSADIEALGEDVRERVKAKTGIMLEWEIQRIGVAQ